MIPEVAIKSGAPGSIHLTLDFSSYEIDRLRSWLTQFLAIIQPFDRRLIVPGLSIDIEFSHQDVLLGDSLFFSFMLSGLEFRMNVINALTLKCSNYVAAIIVEQPQLANQLTELNKRVTNSELSPLPIAPVDDLEKLRKLIQSR